MVRRCPRRPRANWSSWPRRTTNSISPFGASVLNYLSWKEQSQSFEQLGAIGGATSSISRQWRARAVVGATPQPVLLPSSASSRSPAVPSARAGQAGSPAVAHRRGTWNGASEPTPLWWQERHAERHRLHGGWHRNPLLSRRAIVQRHPDGRRASAPREKRCDANHRVVDAVQRDVPAHQRGVAPKRRFQSPSR